MCPVTPMCISIHPANSLNMIKGLIKQVILTVTLHAQISFWGQSGDGVFDLLKMLSLLEKGLRFAEAGILTLIR